MHSYIVKTLSLVITHEFHFGQKADIRIQIFVKIFIRTGIVHENNLNKYIYIIIYEDLSGIQNTIIRYVELHKRIRK